MNESIEEEDLNSYNSANQTIQKSFGKRRGSQPEDIFNLENGSNSSEEDEEEVELNEN
jgi:hypothetical protein